MDNGLGSSEALTAGSGNVVATYKYDVFGAVRSGTGSGSTEYRFAGQQNDAAVGYTYLRARYYDPATGRFISKDPFPGVLTSPASMQYYVYARNNPANFIDPSGFWCVGGGGGGTLEAGLVYGSAATAGLGLAGCAGGPSGMNGGFLADFGANLGAFGSEASYPPPAPGSVTNGTVGAYAGLGPFLTCLDELAGPFEVVSVDAGFWVKGSIQFAWANGIWVLSVSPPIPGVSWGIGGAVSHLWTDTAVWPSANP
ncbi:MAG: RHS repeat-associated core domain-containing protein [Chloroflexi bacterium]|nr:RHS repeat-associated core domain-containing protein [Chloroflexota bacterium]